MEKTTIGNDLKMTMRRI